MSAPTVAFQTRQARLGGELVDLLYALSVTAPIAKTWRLAARPLDAEVLYPGSPAYEGLVRSGSVPGSAALGGQGGAAEITLELANHFGSYGSGGGPRKKFADYFTEPVAGFAGPYDLHEARLTVSVAFHGLASVDVLPLGTFAFVPGSMDLTGDAPGPSTLRLTFAFGTPRLLTQFLPRLKIVPSLFTLLGLPDPARALGRPLALVFGSDCRIPAVRMGVGLYVVCASPADTPVDLTGVSLILADPDSPEQRRRLFVMPSVSNPLDSVSPSGTAFLTIRAVGGVLQFGATPIVLPGAVGDVAVIDSIELEVQHTTDAAITGPAIVRLVENLTGDRPSETLAHPSATVSVLVSSIPKPDNNYHYRTWTFAPKPILRIGRRYWLTLSYGASDGDTDATAGFFRWKTTPAASGSPPFSGALFDPEDTGDARGWTRQSGQPLEFSYKINAVTMTLTDTTTVAGLQVATVQLSAGADLGDDIMLLGHAHGMKDTGSGTYTGVASALIANPSDVARWLLRHAQGVGLAADAVDAASFDRARAALAGWPGLREVLDTPESAEVWLARLMRACKSVWYVDQDGRVAMAVRGTETPPVRAVWPWEHGPITLRGLGSVGGAAAQMPWSRVELFAARDLAALENPDESWVMWGSGRGRIPSRLAEWDTFGLISAEQTSPVDAVRQAQAVALSARYGERGNAEATEDLGTVVSHLTAGYFVSAAAMKTVLNDLWDTGSRRPDAFDLIDVALPRFALGWRVRDHFTLESYDFPMAGPRLLPGHHSTAPTQDGPHLDPKEYQCRRGRYAVVDAVYDPTSNTPVLVTAELVGWEN